MNPHPSGKATPHKAGRPSLYAEAALNATDLQADSILGQLGYSRPRRKSLIGVFVAALASAVAIGWWQAGGFAGGSDTGAMELAEHADGGKALDNIVATAATSQPAPQPANSRPVDAGSQLQGEKENLPANIIADIAPVSGTQETHPSTQLAADTAIASPEADKPSIAAEPGTPPSSAATAFAKKKPAAHSETRMAAKAPPVGKPQASSAGAVTMARSAPQKGKRAEKDGDVELIAALLNRVSANAEPAGVEKSFKQGSAGAQQRTAAAEQKKKNRKSPVMRENVALKPASSTESELKRCISLGFFESEVCRFRACSGRWGRDPACPQSDQISAASP